MAIPSFKEQVSDTGNFTCIYDDSNYFLAAPGQPVPLFECFENGNASSTIQQKINTNQSYRSWCLNNTSLSGGDPNVNLGKYEICYNPLQAQIGITLFIISAVVFTYGIIKLFRKL